MTVKGGGYFFLLGIKALGFIASAGLDTSEHSAHPASAAPERPTAAVSITDLTGPA